MNVKTLGNFLALIGLAVLLVSGYYYRSVNSDDMITAKYDAAVKRINGDSSGIREGLALNRQGELAESRGFTLAVAGGVLLLIGIGVRVSAKGGDAQPGT